MDWKRIFTEDFLMDVISNLTALAIWFIVIPKLRKK